MSPPREILVVDYDPRWPALFEAERALLRGLAENPLIDLEHFGSTAVPGLRAKPVIDMMASVASLEDAATFAPQLAAAGYHFADTGFRHRRFHMKESVADGVAAHLHLVPIAAWADKSERLFRDWLLAHPDVAGAYAVLKTQLAARYRTDRVAYTQAKSAFIQAAVNDACRARGLPLRTAWEE